MGDGLMVLQAIFAQYRYFPLISSWCKSYNWSPSQEKITENIMTEHC